MNRIDNSIVMAIRPRVELIGNVTQLSSEDRSSLGSLTTSQPFTFRKTSQDGNSFYRCLMVSWLVSRKVLNLEEAFPNLSGMNLCIIAERSVPAELRPYYQTSRMNVILGECWDEMKKQLSKNYEETLCQFLNSHLAFDFILNMYIRALINLQYLGEKGVGFDKKSSSSQMCQYGQQPSETSMKTAATAIGTTLRIVEKKGKNMAVEIYRFTPGGNESIIELYKVDGGYHYVGVSKNAKEAIKKIIQSPVAPAKKQQSYEAVPATPDCQRCPWMKMGKCFKCSMLQFRSEVYQKISGRQVIPRFEQQKSHQPELSYKPPQFSHKPPEVSFKVAQTANKPMPKCLQCQEILKKQQEIQTLICGRCSKKVQVEQRIHEFRSKTMDKKVSKLQNVAIPKYNISNYAPSSLTRNNNFVGRRF